jgi:hypothetical protein
MQQHCAVLLEPLCVALNGRTFSSVLLLHGRVQICVWGVLALFDIQHNSATAQQCNSVVIDTGLELEFTKF